MKSLNIDDIPKQLSTGVQVAAKQVSTQRVKLNMYKNERSIMCKFRSGVFRNGLLYWWSIELTTVSVLCESALYNNLRTTYFADIFNHDNSDTLNDNLVYAMTNHPRMLPKFLVYADLLRKKYMYKWNNNVNYTYNVLYICNVNFSTIRDPIIVFLKYLRLFLPIFYVHNRIILLLYMFEHFL